MARNEPWLFKTLLKADQWSLRVDWLAMMSSRVICVVNRLAKWSKTVLMWQSVPSNTDGWALVDGGEDL